MPVFLKNEAEFSKYPNLIPFTLHFWLSMLSNISTSLGKFLYFSSGSLHQLHLTFSDMESCQVARVLSPEVFCVLNVFWTISWAVSFVGIMAFKTRYIFTHFSCLIRFEGLTLLFQFVDNCIIHYMASWLWLFFSSYCPKHFSCSFLKSWLF